MQRTYTCFVSRSAKLLDLSAISIFRTYLSLFLSSYLDEILALTFVIERASRFSISGRFNGIRVADARTQHRIDKL